MIDIKLKIEKNIPINDYFRNDQYGYAKAASKMEVGDSVLFVKKTRPAYDSLEVQKPKYKNLRQKKIEVSAYSQAVSLNRHLVLLGKKAALRRCDEGCRIWRVE